MTTPVGASVPSATHEAGPAPGGAGSRRARRAGDYLALLPFLAYVALFLLLPTLIVTVGAFTTVEGGFTLANVSLLFTDETLVSAFSNSSCTSREAFLNSFMPWPKPLANSGIFFAPKRTKTAPKTIINSPPPSPNTASIAFIMSSFQIRTQS